MQLTELILHNVGVYHGRQTVDLRTAPGRPVVLIGGLNGCGKTTFLDALQLVLYGQRAQLSNRNGQSYEEFLGETINRRVPASEGASISLTFTIDLEGDSREYRVVRAWAATGKRIKERLDVFIDGVWDSAVSASWSDHVEDLLPLEIASLFFFDGEKIEALAESESAAAVIKTAIHSLLGISTLEQLRSDLLALQRRQVVPGENQALDQRVLDLTEEHGRVQQQLDETAQRRGKVRQALTLAERTVQKAESAFERAGGALFERQVSLRTRRSGAAEQLDASRSSLRGLAEGSLPLTLVSDQIEVAIDRSEREARAQDGSRMAALLEQRDKWLLEQVPKPTKSVLQKVLEEDRAARRVGTDAESILNLTPGARGELRALPSRLTDQKVRAHEVLASIKELMQQIDQLDRELAGVPQEELIAQLQAETQDANRRVALLEGQLVVLDDDMQRLRRELVAVQDQLGRAEADRIRNAILADDVQRVIQHSEKVRTTLSDLRTRLIGRHIGKIEIATLDSFRRLMRKEGLVADLRIDPDTFAIQLISNTGEPIAASRLSAGERQLLATALLWGLARVAGHLLPTVIDTPLGRLDSKHREHLVDRYFPQAGGQVLLLSTDEEIDQVLLDRLSPAISQSYILEHDDKEQTTTVTSGYWWPLEVPDVA